MNFKIVQKILKFKNFNQNGFTLIELLLSIALVGIITSIVLILYKPSTNSENMKNESVKLISLIELAREEAIMQGREMGMRFTEDGYQFLDFDPRRELWSVRKNDHLLRERVIPAHFNHKLFLENKDISFTEKENNETKSEIQLSAPHIIFFSSGELSPFEYFIFNDDQTISVTGSFNGAVEIENNDIN